MEKNFQKPYIKPYALALVCIVFIVSSCKNNNESVVQKDPNVYYTCSMDPQVVEFKPGKCPICHMELTKVRKTNGDKDEIHLSEQQIQLGNIQTDTIRQGSIDDQIVLTGTLNFDQSKTNSISSRVMGRIEKLYFKSIGDHVKKGAALYDLYSEELNSAKQEYLLALEQKKTFIGETTIDFEQLVRSGKNKLLLWGMTEQQIRKLEIDGNASPVTTFYSNERGFATEFGVQEGEYVMEGGPIIKLVDLSTLWVEAQVYTSQMRDIHPGSVATIQLPGFEGKEIKGMIEFINPEINPDTRINLIRVSVSNIGNQLKPGMAAYVILENDKHNSLTLPIDAIIRNGRQNLAWIQVNRNTFKSVMVETGMEGQDRIEIKSGLNKGDVVVTSGAYLINSEYIFKKGSDPMEGHNH